MPFRSKRAVKVYDIPPGTTKEQYQEFVEHLCAAPEKRGALSSLPIVSRLTNTALTLNSQSWREITFATQNGQAVGTIAFSTPKAKTIALERHEEDGESAWKDWIVTDDFQGITVLRGDANDQNTEVDVCMVHGLGSNAVDAWTAKNGRMWPRDFLPTASPFDKSRIMTFGCDSDLTDTSTVMTLENWAESLLYRINEVRISKAVPTYCLLDCSLAAADLSWNRRNPVRCSLFATR